MKTILTSDNRYVVSPFSSSTRSGSRSPFPKSHNINIVNRFDGSYYSCGASFDQVNAKSNIRISNTSIIYISHIGNKKTTAGLNSIHQNDNSTFKINNYSFNVSSNNIKINMNVKKSYLSNDTNEKFNRLNNTHMNINKIYNSYDANTILVMNVNKTYENSNISRGRNRFSKAHMNVNKIYNNYNDTNTTIFLMHVNKPYKEHDVNRDCKRFNNTSMKTNKVHSSYVAISNTNFLTYANKPCKGCDADRACKRFNSTRMNANKISNNYDATKNITSAGQINRSVLSNADRLKLSSSSDREFYSFPRFVTHVDDAFLATLTELYRKRIPPGAEVMDLMSSWVSHLPPEVQYKRVVGHGLNAQELARNPRLDYFFVKDLNEEETLEAKDCSFDAVLCTVSVQYLQYPEKVFAEIYRILRPGGVCIVSFSNRMFYDKAIRAWRDGTNYSRIQLVVQYFLSVTGFTQPEVVKKLPGSEEKSPFGWLFQFLGRMGRDPFFAVISYKNFKPI